MIIIVAKQLLQNLRVNGMALYPFLLLKEKHLCNDSFLINHERIHFRQQLELLIIFFYLFYGINYLINLIKYQNHLKAYYNVVFEREAFENEWDLDYLKKRRFFAFLQYWFKK